MQLRGVNGSGADDTAPASAPAPARPAAGRGRGAFLARAAPAPKGALQPAGGIVVTVASLQHTSRPCIIERDADAADLKIIRELYGSRSQTIINALLSFDAYFEWYYALKEDSPSIFSSKVEREACALDNMQKAIKMHEIFERLAIRNHGSYVVPPARRNLQGDSRHHPGGRRVVFLPLAARAPERRDQADGHARRISAASDVECRADASQGAWRRGAGAHHCKTKGYSTSMAVSTLKRLLGAHRCCATAMDSLRYLTRAGRSACWPAVRRLPLR